MRSRGRRNAERREERIESAQNVEGDSKEVENEKQRNGKMRKRNK